MPGFVELHELATPSVAGQTSVVVLVSCYNRRSVTLRGLDTLAKTVGPTVRVSVVLYDDGSSDGTAEAVQRAHPAVTTIRGRGQSFWSASMATAQESALSVTRPDYLLWLNDDVELLPDALETLLSTARQLGDAALVIGPLLDSGSGVTTYSGYRRTGRRPLSLAIVAPSGLPQRVATFNGNVVLVPHKVYEEVGNIDGSFEHAYGDVDYGYRATAMGHLCWIAPRWVGSCSRNSPAGTWLDPHVGLRKRVTLLLGRKGMPLRSHYRFFKRHGGRIWSILLIASYARNLGRIFESWLLHRLATKRY